MSRQSQQGRRQNNPPNAASQQIPQVQQIQPPILPQNPPIQNNQAQNPQVPQAPNTQRQNAGSQSELIGGGQQKKEEKIDHQKLAQDIIFFYEKTIQTFEKSYKEIQDTFTKLNMTAVIDFQCSFTKQPIKYAVYFAKCAEGKKHFESYLDLQSILETYYNSTETKSFKCPICSGVTAFDDIKKAFFPQLLINHLKKQLNEIPKSLTYVFTGKYFYPNYSGDIGKKSNTYLENIIEQFQQPKKQQCFFYQLIQKYNIDFEFLFYNVCSLTQMKVMIPVRGDSCEHLEVYDLVAIINHFKEKQITEMKCVRPQCEKKLTLKTLAIDFDLYETSLKSYSFSFSYKYYPNKNQLIDTLISERDFTLFSYKSFSDLIEYQKYQQTIYKIVDNVYNNAKNQEKTDKFYENNKEYGDLNLMQCQYTQSRIEIPCRCVNCPQLQVCDLRFMSCVLHQFQHQDDVKNVKKVIINCPLCQTPFKKKIKPKDLPLNEQIYTDVKMMQFLTVTNSFANITKKDYLDYLKNKVIPRILITEEASFISKKTNAILKIALKCPISNQRIKRPVVGNLCEHAQPFDFTIIDMHYSGQIDLTTMECPICKKKFDHFINDQFLKHGLDNYYAQTTQESNEVNLNITNHGLTIKHKS